MSTCIDCHTGIPVGSANAYVCTDCCAASEARSKRLEKHARKVICPDCKAKPGKPCKTGSGKDRSHHSARIMLAIKAHGEVKL